MALKDVCSKLNLDINDDMEDSTLEEKITNRVDSLLEELKKKEPEEKKLEENKSSIFPSGILNIIAKDRDMEITNLVKEGKIVPAVADKLRSKFAKRESIVDCINDDGEPIDGFETIISALKENEKVINFGDQTKISLPKGDDGKLKESALVIDAKARGSS